MTSRDREPVSPQQALAELWSLAAGSEEALERVTIEGADPVLPSVFRVGTAAAAVTAATGLAASELWRARTGRAQTVAVAMRAAAINFRCERYLRIDDGEPPGSWDPLAGYYRTGDGGWIQLHTNFPHHRQGVLDLLDCEPTREAVKAAVALRRGADLEERLAERGMCVGFLRSTEHWRRHPHGEALATLPLFEIDRLGDAEEEPLANGSRPLEGVRVLDLTRVIAGPVCGRELASHGATVLRVAGPRLPSFPSLVIESGRGKLSAFVDLEDEEGRARLRALVREADVFVQGYRPGALAARGFSPQDVARLRPGIVYVSLSAYGRRGPWSERRGFDSLVQTVSGIAQAGMEAAGVGRPRPLPCQALDHASGFLAAFGAMIGLGRRIAAGGSWHVRLSLAQTGRWIESLGRIDGLDCTDPGFSDVGDLLESRESPFGKITHVKSPVGLSETPPHWRLPPVPLGTHPPEWPTLRR